MEDTVARTCSVEGCERSHYARTYCHRHYLRYRNGLDMNTPIGKSRPKNPKGEIPHGTSGGYTNHRCRCDACRLAWNEVVTKRRKKLADAWDGTPDPSLKHGLASTYGNYGCRCEDCKKAASTPSVQLARQKRRPEFGPWRDQIKSCQICGRGDRKLVVDHDHNTGEIRGVLCHSCNTAIGKLGDSVDMLLVAIEYLSRPAVSESWR